MASPVADQYSGASGGSIVGGRYRMPDWLPAIGSIADVGLNTIQGVSGGDTSAVALFTAWNGDAYATEYGKYGSIIYHGGGHGDRSKNGVYRYDIESRLCSKIVPDAPVYLHSDTYCADTSTGWLWSATSGTDQQIGQPFFFRAVLFEFGGIGNGTDFQEQPEVADVPFLLCYLK